MFYVFGVIKRLERRVVIDMVSVKTYSRYFIVSLGKILYGIFTSLMVLASNSKFQSYLCKTIKQSKISTEQQYLGIFEQVGVIACPMYSTSVAFLRVRRINIDIKKNVSVFPQQRNCGALSYTKNLLIVLPGKRMFKIPIGIA